MPFVQRVVTPIYISRAKKTRQPPPRRPSPLLLLHPTGTAVGDSVRWPPSTTTTTTIDAIDASNLPPPPPPSPPLPPPPPTQSNAYVTIEAPAPPPPLCDNAPDAGSPATASPATTTTTASTCVVARATGVTASEQTHPQHHHHQHHQQHYHQHQATAMCSNDGSEFDAVTNRTLSNALRQLASLMLIANDIFAELHAELQAVGERTGGMRGRVERMVRTVDAFDPKLVAVPESDLATFVQIQNHFRPVQRIETALFTPTTRPDHVRQLYEAAAKTPVEAIDEMARLSGDTGHRRGSDVFVCTPVLGQNNRRRMRTNVDVEIETRMPAAIDDLRRWTSAEAIGDITVTPDCVSRVAGGSSQQQQHSNSTAATMSHSHSLALSSLHATSSAASSSGDADTIDASAATAATTTVADLSDDMPLDHRLPSPEEQCHIIAMRFPAELIRVDTSARRFERMCSTRKSMLNVPVSSRQSRAAAAAASNGGGGGDDGTAEGGAAGGGDDDDIQTHPSQTGVKRRSRSRKPRNKRRNTIAGTDQREIEEAAKGDAEEAAFATNQQLITTEDSSTGYATLTSSTAAGSSASTTATTSPLYVPRSKSSDILKRDSDPSATATTKSSHRLSHFNTLKQWGRNRLRLAMQRGEASAGTITSSTASTATLTGGGSPPSKVSDADDDCNVYETCISKSKRKFLEKERRLSHERKPSYSSSEKSLGCTTITSSSQSTTSAQSGGHVGGNVAGNAMGAHGQAGGSGHNGIGVGGSMQLSASINPVKFRESSALRRQRRCGLGHKDELNSSSGNWSASSESGRTSIGSELTVPPKSSASSTSLNHSHMSGHSQSTMGGMGGGSGPPSSIISRRRFLNTSASSSVTSEGTVTPDIQIVGGAMMDAYDDETSSAYSCDTEGYYTSFHVDSGLKTLKEEEAPMTPLHSSSALSSTNSFGSTSNKTVLSAADEYELFGKGSTSTTASSAGTVCTTLMGGHGHGHHGHQQSASASGSDRCLVMMATSPSVPERKSSLTLNRSNSTTSTSTLERSCSSSTVGSTLERTGTIKRNGVLLTKKADLKMAQQQAAASGKRLESPDSGNQTSSPPIVAMDIEPQSESSDFEGVERVERMRTKTAINTSRIPSMCVITPSNSDDDDGVQQLQAIRARHASPPRAPHVESEYAEVSTTTSSRPTKPLVVGTELKRDYFKLPSMLGRLKGVLPHLHKKSPHRDTLAANSSADPDEPIYDHAGGEYVTIADVTNNNQMKRQTSSGYYYSNDLLKQNLAAVLQTEETEYVSLNELPTARCGQSNLLAAPRTASRPNMFGGGVGGPATAPSTAGSTRAVEKINTAAAKVGGCDGAEGVANAADDVADADAAEADAAADAEHRNRGARVTLDANGKVVYNSDSLKRRKGAHTTFAPGPCVKEIATPTEAAAAAAVQHDASRNNSISSEPTTSAAVRPHHQGDPGAVIVLNQQQIAAVLSTPKRQPVSAVRPVISQSLHRPIAHHVPNPKPTTSVVNVPIPTVPTISDSHQNSSSSGDDNEMLTQQPHQPPPTREDFMVVGQGYPHSSRDVPDAAGPAIYTRPAGPMSATLPRRPTSSGLIARQQQPPMQLQQLQHHQHQPQPPTQRPLIPFQRSDNAYWTLQLRKPQQSAAPAPPLRDRTVTRPQPIEELYSTPNKAHKQRPGGVGAAEQLRSTAHGFGNYFSPIAKSTDTNNAAASSPTLASGVSPIDPRPIGLGFRTSTPTRAPEAPSTPLSSLTDELRHKLHLQQQQQQLYAAAAEGSYHHQYSSTSSPAAPSSPFAAGSPLSSGRSTPLLRAHHQHQHQLEPQRGSGADAHPLPSTSCSDRLGTPKTTLLDFKKLLLSKATGKAAPQPGKKPSAVEQLRLAKAAAAATAAAGGSGSVGGTPSTTASAASALNASMNIIDLSGSPKTFANRRMIRQGNFGSPSKGAGPAAAAAAGSASNAELSSSSPRTAWKYSTGIGYRTDVMTTAIPEVNSEEDASNSSSSCGGSIGGSAGSNSDAASTVTAIETAAVATIESPDASSSASEETSESSMIVVSAAAATDDDDGSSSPASSTASADDEQQSRVIGHNINLKTNIFLQAEENNFMRGEQLAGGGGTTKSLSRAQLAQARSQFLAGGMTMSAAATATGGSSAPGSPLMQQTQRLAQFKNGHYTGLSPTRTMMVPSVTTAAAAAAAAASTTTGGGNSSGPNSKFQANTEAILDTSSDVPTPSLETAL